MSEIAKAQSVATSVHSKLAISKHAQTSEIHCISDRAQEPSVLDMSNKQGFFEHSQKSKIFDEPSVFDNHYMLPL